MASVRGRDEVKRRIRQTSEEIERKLLPGAARAAAKVIAQEAAERSASDEVAQAIRVRTKREPGRVIAKVQVAGPGAYKAPWLEYGTAPHFISVDEQQREGRSVGRINRLAKAGALEIDGMFVGDTVFHPGARPHPFLRPALDTKEGEAIAAAQAWIDSHVGPTGVRAEATGEDGQE